MSYGPPPGPPPGGFTPPPGYPSGGQPAAQPPKNYLWMNILGILGCTVIGIIGLVFSLQVNKKWEMGDYAGAESASSTAKILRRERSCCGSGSSAAPERLRRYRPYGRRSRRG